MNVKQANFIYGEEMKHLYGSLNIGNLTQKQQNEYRSRVIEIDAIVFKHKLVWNHQHSWFENDNQEYLNYDD